MDKSLYEKLKEYAKGDHLAMHMPGHKRNEKFLKGFPIDIDITEIDGFDNLHNMQGVLLDTAELAAKIYGATMCYPLVNGSSAGILAAITAEAGAGGCVLMARNCHKSVYHAVQINGLKAYYLYPDVDEYGILGGIDAKAVEAELKDKGDIRAVILTSPTFEGVVSDVKEIAEVCHRFEVPLIVDAAHGAHFGFHSRFPKNAVECGADYAVMSLHKTLPALTQCALLAVNDENGMVNLKKVEFCLSLYETTSPSYILMAAIDECLRTIKKGANELFSQFVLKLDALYDALNGLKKLKAIKLDDPSKIVISCRGTNMTGTQLAEVLRSQFFIEVEMAYTDYVVMIATICDKPNDYERLCSALLSIDERLAPAPAKAILPAPRLVSEKCAKEAVLADETNIKAVSLKEAGGELSAEYVFAYPPGIPLIVPGERIDNNIVSYLNDIQERGTALHSTYGGFPESLRILKYRE